MNFKKFKPKSREACLTFITALSMISPQSHAQMYSSYGPRVDGLNKIFNPPQMGIIKDVLCKGYINADLGALKYKACSDGIDAAHYMAQKYAANSGKFLGCLDGMNQGINDGYLASVNPSQAVTTEAEKFVAGATFESATKRATEKAKLEGQTDAAKQLVERYRAVVGRVQGGKPVLPSKEYDYPRITFNGFEDGYTHDILNTNTAQQSDLNEIYRLGWINANADEETKIAARSVYQINSANGGSLCSLEQTIFGRQNMPRFTFWDYWRAQRAIDFQLYRWDNKDWAWDIFVNDEKTLGHYVNFNKIPESKKMAQVPITRRDVKLDENGNPVKKLDANGQPVLDAQGKPVFEYVEVITGYENREVLISAEEAAELKGIYANQFKVSYERELANHYASVSYNKEGVESYKVAKLLGTKIGEEVARYRAYKSAYNKKYQLESAKVFANTVHTMYETNFNRILNIFENQSVYDLKAVTVLGMIDDNIFTPGEELAADVTIANLGEKAKDGKLYMAQTSEVNALAAGHPFSINPLTQSRMQTPVLGVINPGLLARENVNVKLTLNNPGDLAEVAKSLNSSASQSLKLRNYIELDKVETALNLFTGEVEVIATVQNPASVAMPTVADLIMTDNKSASLTKVPVLSLAGGTSQRVILRANHLDPLNLIDTKNLSIKVDATLAGKAVSSLTSNVAINGNPVEQRVEYFARLAAGLTRNSGNQSVEDRMDLLKEFILKAVKAEIGKKVRWGKQKEFSKTTLNIVLEQYAKLQRAGALNSEAQFQFNELGVELAKFAPGLKAKGWFNDKKHRKAYLSVIKKFSTTQG
jgi:hypothetical protein